MNEQDQPSETEVEIEINELKKALKRLLKKFYKSLLLSQSRPS